MNLFNSLTQQVEPLVIHDNHVGLYVCGVTPYDTTHAGHAFTFLTFDILVRYLRYLGHRRHLRSERDRHRRRHPAQVERARRRLGRARPRARPRSTCAICATSTRLPFDHYLRATETFPRWSTLIEALVAERARLRTPTGSVYFSVASDPDFGKLSRIPRDEMLPIANERGNTSGRSQQARPARFRALAGGQARASRPGNPVGPGPARLAHRVQRDVDELPRPDDRHSWRWRRSHLPASRVRDRPDRERHRRQPIRPLLDARRHGRVPGREDEQVARQSGDRQHVLERYSGGRVPPLSLLLTTTARSGNTWTTRSTIGRRSLETCTRRSRRLHTRSAATPSTSIDMLICSWQRWTMISIRPRRSLNCGRSPARFWRLTTLILQRLNESSGRSAASSG